jgi:hypothetical protein
MKTLAITILLVLSSCASHDAKMRSDLASYWKEVGPYEENEVDVLNLHFEINEPFDQNEAKKLLIEMAQKYLPVVNTDPVLQKFSPVHPVTFNDLTFALSYKNPTPSPSKYVASIFLEKGVIHYLRYDPVTQSPNIYLTEKLEDALKEFTTTQ